MNIWWNATLFASDIDNREPTNSPTYQIYEYV